MTMSEDAKLELVDAGVPENGFVIAHSKSPVFYDVYQRKPELQQQTHYCPGCGHGVIHKLIAEAIHDLGLQENTIFISPVGCSVFAYYYFDLGNVQVAHGRAPAAATAIKRSCPGKIVISYQGDGDLAAIGTAEIVHAANRGEKISVFFVNNAIYGMTGGQLAPTTLLGQKTTTSPFGRQASKEGHPLHMAELLATLEAPAYIERVAVSDNKNIMKARRAIRRALEKQRDGIGFSFVEILSPCPTIWGMEPVAARKWVQEQMIPVYPLNVFRDRGASPASEQNGPQPRSIPEVLGLQSESANAFSEATALEHNFQTMTLKIAGFGGQGVLLLGQLLAEAGTRAGLEVSWIPSYGPEMRSGSAYCQVCLSTSRIGSPLVSHPDLLVAMNEISLRKFAGTVAHDGLILYNGKSVPADLAAPARVMCIPASSLADSLGSGKVANVVLLGALLKETGCLEPQALLEAIQAKTTNSSLLEANRKALDAGWHFVEESTPGSLTTLMSSVSV
jgi:2-oxoisovalerate ferredoxin oxidoreductase beta subunit